MCAVFVAAAASAMAQISEARPMPATVTVSVGADGIERVPASIFGSFLEPIGNSINGGVVAEIEGHLDYWTKPMVAMSAVRNKIQRSFAYGSG